LGENYDKIGQGQIKTPQASELRRQEKRQERGGAAPSDPSQCGLLVKRC